ncbi:permease [Blastopirellula retiformator]|uniref:Putative permease n=1 Tax=Blastopirellula retiformator TaxID=2527970 RepID=A0A5C5UW94_9BACT|nr:permease [Blastopirellula retiformator]TWT29635.1 putative permease [Blastopirellula retiformator]
MIQLLFWGAILRFCQAGVAAIPTIMIGILVAAIFRVWLGPAGTRRLFGGSGMKSLFAAWLIGMLLPVCSLGVIPVAMELRRAKLSGGTILAFALTAPLFNPISVLYGLTLSDPLVIITFSFCSLVIVTGCGWLWDRFFPTAETEDLEASEQIPEGWRRLLATATFGLRQVTGPAMGYVIVGLLGVALLSAILPYGSLQQSAEHDDPTAILFMTAIAIPAYATPMVAMVQLASMFAHGNSVGAAFSLLALGAGANVGLIAWMTQSYGWSRTAAWFGLLIGIVVGLAYSVDGPLYPQGVEPAGHTHAFDGYCRPFSAGTANPITATWTELTKKIAPHEKVAVMLFGVALLFAIGLRLADPQQRLESWLRAAPPAAPQKFDRTIPGPVLGAISLVGLVITSIAGCYLYYPPPHEIFEEMRAINAEVIYGARTAHWEVAQHWIPIYDDWSRKLEVSQFLRSGEVEPYHQYKGQVFREYLERLEHAVEDEDQELAKELSSKVGASYTRLRKSYLEPVPLSPAINAVNDP